MYLCIYYRCAVCQEVTRRYIDQDIDKSHYTRLQLPLNFVKSHRANRNLVSKSPPHLTHTIDLPQDCLLTTAQTSPHPHTNWSSQPDKGYYHTADVRENNNIIVCSAWEVWGCFLERWEAGVGGEMRLGAFPHHHSHCCGCWCQHLHLPYLMKWLRTHSFRTSVLESRNLLVCRAIHLARRVSYPWLNLFTAPKP